MLPGSLWIILENFYIFLAFFSPRSLCAEKYVKKQSIFKIARCKSFAWNFETPFTAATRCDAHVCAPASERLLYVSLPARSSTVSFSKSCFAFALKLFAINKSVNIRARTWRVWFPERPFQKLFRISNKCFCWQTRALPSAVSAKQQFKEEPNLYPIKNLNKLCA